MAKCPPDPVSIAAKYLARSGHALEHFTAKTLIEHGWNPTMALQVPGADGTPRDCDVLAHRPFMASGGSCVSCSAAVLIECKHVPEDRVWILMGSTLANEYGAIPTYIPNATGERRMLQCAFGDSSPVVKAQGVPELSIGIVEARIGESKRNDRDSAFSAVEKVIDLSWSVVNRLDLTRGMGGLTVAQFVVPIVVVRGALVRAEYCPNRAALISRAVDRGRLIHAVPPRSTRVEVTTDKGLPTLLREIEADARYWSRNVLTWIKNHDDPKAKHPWKPLIRLARDRVPLDIRRARRAAKRASKEASAE